MTKPINFDSTILKFQTEVEEINGENDGMVTEEWRNDDGTISERMRKIILH